MKQEDRRVRRTRKLLAEALLALISEKEYDDITIIEVTERADIGHRTFYRHYTDKDELLIDVMKSVLSGFRDLLVLPSNIVFLSGEAESEHLENGRKLFQYVGEREEIFRVLFKVNPSIYQPMLDFARQNAFDVLHDSMNEKDSPIPFRIIANHLTTSSIELMKLWLADGKPYSAEIMGEYLFQMVFKPMRNLLIEKQ